MLYHHSPAYSHRTFFPAALYQKLLLAAALNADFHFVPSLFSIKMADTENHFVFSICPPLFFLFCPDVCTVSLQRRALSLLIIHKASKSPPGTALYTAVHSPYLFRFCPSARSTCLPDWRQLYLFPRRPRTSATLPVVPTHP